MFFKQIACKKEFHSEKFKLHEFVCYTSTHTFFVLVMLQRLRLQLLSFARENLDNFAGVFLSFP